MEITVEHHGIRLTLDVYSEDGVDLFTVTGFEQVDAPYGIRELGLLLKDGAAEIERLGHEELARVRRVNRLDFEESRAA